MCCVINMALKQGKHSQTPHYTKLQHSFLNGLKIPTKTPTTKNQLLLPTFSQLNPTLLKKNMERHASTSRAGSKPVPTAYTTDTSSFLDSVHEIFEILTPSYNFNCLYTVPGMSSCNQNSS